MSDGQTPLLSAEAFRHAFHVGIGFADPNLQARAQALVVEILGDTPLKQQTYWHKITFAYTCPDFAGSRAEFDRAVTYYRLCHFAYRDPFCSTQQEYVGRISVQLVEDDAAGVPAVTLDQIKRVRRAIDQFVRSFEIVRPEVVDSFGRSERDYLYLPGERHFGAAAEAIAANGWAVYPQERDDRRLPAAIDGYRIKWGAFLDKAPPPELIHRWSIHAATKNTAAILGPASGNIIALDCDIEDEELSFAVRDVAKRVLGESPLRRVGSHPKIALFYRTTAGELPRYSKHEFQAAEGSGASGDAIEVLGRGRSITIQGIHWKTGKYITWLYANPISASTELAPLVTTAKLAEFFAEVEKLRPFFRKHRDLDGIGDGFGEPIIDNDGSVALLFPQRMSRGVTGDSGLIVDDREGFIFEFVQLVVRLNPAAVCDATRRKEIKARIVGRLSQLIEVDGRWRTELTRHVDDKYNRAVQALRNGVLHALTVNDRKSGEGDDTFSWLNAATIIRGITMKGQPDPVKAEQRRLITDRHETSADVADQVSRFVGRFISDMKTAGSSMVYMLRAVVGAGKTTSTFIQIASDPWLQQRREQAADAGEDVGPVVFLLPMHNNIRELHRFAQLTHLSPLCTNDELVLGAVENGFDPEEARQQVDKIRRFALGRYVRTEILRGRLTDGCLRKEFGEKLENVHISSSILCKSTMKNEEGQQLDRYCPHYNECPVIAHRRRLKGADIVLAARNYATLPLPPELKNPAGVIIDERLLGQRISAWTFPLDTLTKGRAAPALTKKEREAGIDEGGLMRRREEACHIAVKALDAGEDVAQAIMSVSRKLPGGQLTGMDLIKAARRMCSTGFTRSHGLDPGAPDGELADQVRELVTEPKGLHVRQEYSFWATVEDRAMKLSVASVAGRDIANDSGDRVPEVESRIQLLVEDGAKHVRVSLDHEQNWGEAPLLLLDASADANITERLFAERDVVTADVDAQLNARVLAVLNREWAISRLIPRADADPRKVLECAVYLAQTRSVISMISGIHANGRVLVCLPKKYRKAVELGWAKPKNLDFVHPGAVAGLDFARSHVAGIVIGRTEAPESAVDGVVGGLVYKTLWPEAPINWTGTGLIPDGSAPLPRVPPTKRVLKLRNGQDIELEVRKHAGKFASAVQSQVREEEVMQAIGRLRPLHRKDTPVFYLLTKAISENVIVDQLASFEELIVKARWWEAARRSAGILNAGVLAEVGPDIGPTGYFTEQIAKLPASIKDRYHRMSVDGEATLVPGRIADPEKFLRSALKLRHDTKIEMIKECMCRVDAADVRPDDYVELYLDAIDNDRYEDQFLASQSRYLRSLNIDLVKTKGRYPPSPGLAPGLENERQTVDVWQAYSSIMDEWIRQDIDMQEEHVELAEIEAWLAKAKPRSVTTAAAATPTQPSNDPLVRLVNEIFGMDAGRAA